MPGIAQDSKKMQQIIASMIDGVIVFDMEDRVVLANKAAENLLMVHEGELMGKNLQEVSPCSELVNMVHYVIRTGNEVFTETELIPNIQIYRVHVAPVKEDDIVESVVVIFHDVTDARNFDQMKSQFVGNVSHELRTPLTSIKGFVETLLDGATENAEICRRFLTIIDTETDRLTRLIEDLLTLSAIESKERKIQPKSVYLICSIRGVMNILGPQISEKSLQVELIYPADLPRVYADEDLLGQVLINLLDNAIKFTPQGGRITIRCKRKESRVVVTITDTGVGIPKDSLPRVFERFYRVDKARSRHRGGTGLGLAIVKHIVESHGGEVFVDSEVGKGSTFGVSFLVV